MAAVMGHDKQQPPELDIPDLDTDLAPRPSAAAPRLATQAAPPTRDFDDDFEFGSGGGIGSGGVGSGGGVGTFGELDLDDGASVGGGADATDPGGGVDFGDFSGAGALAGAGLAGGDFDPDFDELEGSTTAAVATARSHAPDKRRPWPTGVTREPDPTALDRRDVDELSAYGEPPESVALAPVYTARVFSRRRELQALTERAREELADRERARDDLLGNLVREVRPALASEDRTRKLLEKIDAAQVRVDHAKQELRGANAEYSRQVETTDRTIAQAEARLAETERAARIERESAGAARDAQKRLEAQEKRLYIELRPLAESTTPLSPQQATRSQQLEQQIAALKPGVARAKGATRAAEDKHAAAEGVVDAAHRALREARRQRKGLDLTFGKEIQSQSAGLEGAETELREQLAETGRDVLGLKGTIAVSETTLESLVAADERVADQALELLRHTTALTSFDDERYKQGLMIAGGAVALVVALLLYWIFG